MSDTFTPLRGEMSRWRDVGMTLPLWWRDDDAIAPGAALDRLAALARDAGWPVHLAVIPEAATTSLALRLNAAPDLVPMVHGWAHRNHAPDGQKKSEFAEHRPLPARIAEARAGLERLRGLFGARLCPVFVPPWNRIGADLLPALPGLGYRALSTFGPRHAPLAAPGLAAINTHLDPIDWHGSRSLHPPEKLVARIVRDLRDRRAGRTDNAEPYGLLTHHLVHDDAIWDFTGALISEISAGPVRICSLADEAGQRARTASAYQPAPKGPQ